MIRKPKSAILEAAHDTAKGLYQAGLMDQVTLREVDRLWLLPVESLRIRQEERATSAIFGIMRAECGK